jgi:excisionase family DNA binding protein
VTVKEAAKRLDVSPSLVYAPIATGKLGCVRHGLKRGTIRISEEHLREYLALAEGWEACREPLKYIR